MGSYDFTCTVSKLPISAGEKVKFLMLTASPYSDIMGCYVHDLWFPRCYALNGKYDDYGGVDSITGQKDLWLKGLQEDLVPVGWGDNSCHDLPTDFDMSFDQLMEALSEGRVFVKRDLSNYDYELKGEDLEGVPTLAKVREKLVELGFVLGRGENAGGRLLVGEEGYGRIRVREDGYKLTGLLNNVATALSPHYATMVTCGTGRYAHQAELLVRPLPGVEKYFYMENDKAKEAPLAVRRTVIREDVWLALCDMHDKRIEEIYYKDEGPASKAREDFKRLKTLDDLVIKYGSTFSDIRNPVPFTVGLGTAFVAAAKENLSEEAEEEFLTSVEQTLKVEIMMSLLRLHWTPSYSNGPQSGEWQIHEEFADTLKAISHKKVEEDRAQREEYEKWAEEYNKKKAEEDGV